MLELDHIVVGAGALAEARGHVEQALGLPMLPGGAHPIFHTHNALLGLEDRIYLEAIAPNPDAPEPERPRWFDLDHHEGPARLTNWACRTDDLDAMVARFPEAGEILELSRGDLRWRMAVPPTGVLPFDGLFPALLEWRVPEIPPDRLEPVARLTRLTLRHPWCDALEALLSPVLNDARLRFEQGPAALLAEVDVAGQSRRL